MKSQWQRTVLPAVYYVILPSPNCLFAAGHGLLQAHALMKMSSTKINYKYWSGRLSPESKWSITYLPYTSGFFYIKTNFFNKRSFTRVAQSTKVHFHKPPPWEEALWDIFIWQRGNQMQFGVGRLRCGIIQVYPLSTNGSNFVSLSKILFKTSYVFKRKIPSDTSIHISVNEVHLYIF